MSEPDVGFDFGIQQKATDYEKTGQSESYGDNGLAGRAIYHGTFPFFIKDVIPSCVQFIEYRHSRESGNPGIYGFRVVLFLSGISTFDCESV